MSKRDVLGVEKEVKVCIRCKTYNQSSYIIDALNGFVMQRTDFPFVVVIIDDASTDGEQEVIRKYVDEYFDHSPESGFKEWETEDALWTFAQHDENRNCHFVVVYLKKNLFGNPKKNEITKEFLQSKYIAICEGDDYWTDPLKLQKQVGFLETHSEYDMVCSRFDHLIHETGEMLHQDLYDKIIPPNVDGLEIKQTHFIAFAQPHPCTVMYRAETLYDNDIIGKLKFKFDLPVYYCFLYKHRAWLMNEKMAVHTLHQDSLTRQGYSEIWNMYLAYEEICQHVPNDTTIRRICANRYRVDYLIPNSKKEDYNLKEFIDNFRIYSSYQPSFRNKISAIRRIIQNVINRKLKK